MKIWQTYRKTRYQEGDSDINKILGSFVLQGRIGQRKPLDIALEAEKNARERCVYITRMRREFSPIIYGAILETFETEGKGHPRIRDSERLINMLTIGVRAPSFAAMVVKDACKRSKRANGGRGGTKVRK